MFADLLAVVEGTEKLPIPMREQGMGVNINAKLPTYPPEAYEITIQQEMTITTRNSFGYRCDEFPKQGDKKPRILFSGCSTTYGVGLNINDTWAKKVYDELSLRHDLGPYINIARPGNSVFGIVSDVFKYINEYGKPDVIALAFPSIFRGYKIERLGQSYNLYNSHFPLYFSKSTEELSPVIDGLMPYIVDYIMMLDFFCRSNDIALRMFAWDETLKNETYGMSAYLMERLEHIENIPMKLFDIPDGKKGLFANDNAHLGVTYHKVFKNHMLDLIEGGLK